MTVTGDEYVDIVQDFEMLGPGDQARVIGVGASAFWVNVESEPRAELLYEAWPIGARRDQEHRTIDLPTVAWWSRQSPAVRDVAFRSMGDDHTAYRPLRLAVHDLWAAAITRVREVMPDVTDPWRAVRWWAKPSAADGALWMSLLREFKPDLAMLYGRCRDARTLWEAAQDATGDVFEEALRPADDVHAPGADSLATAWACARAKAALLHVRETLARQAVQAT